MGIGEGVVGISGLRAVGERVGGGGIGEVGWGAGGGEADVVDMKVVVTA